MTPGVACYKGPTFRDDDSDTGTLWVDHDSPTINVKERPLELHEVARVENDKEHLSLPVKT